jgi:1,4-dihydroxy-2-naphthoyl-CoA hydrolase
MPRPTLHDALSFEFPAVSGEYARGRFTIDDRHRQPQGLVHGGVYAAMAEALASEGTVEGVGRDEALTVLGMSNDTVFLRPVSEGTIEAEGEPFHRGRTTWIWDIRFTNGGGRLCAVSRVTIAVRPKHS